MSLDGICDHTVLMADDEIHQHYNDLLKSAGILVYGRITYQLMESYWPTVVKNPTGNKPIDEFAVIIEDIPKIVFSHTLESVDWKNARLARKDLEEEILQLKQQTGNDVLVGSRSLIITLLNLNLVDEFQLCVQPIIAGSGMRLFEKINDRIQFKLVKTKTLSSSGSLVLYYEPLR